MLVTKKELPKVIAKLSKAGEYGLDTETTGLNVYGGMGLVKLGFPADRLFCIIISDEKESYYFDFSNGPTSLGKSNLQKLKPILANPNSTFYIHNAKYDQAILAAEGLWILGRVHCTMAIGRVVRNDLFDYRLKALTKKYLGDEKDDGVEDFIKEHDLITRVPIDGVKEPLELKHFDRVPLRVMVPYAEQDTKLHRDLGRYQIAEIKKLDAALPATATKRVACVFENEVRLTKTLFKMEQAGIRVNMDYCEQGYIHCKKKYLVAATEFEKMSGIVFNDGRTVLKKAFDSVGEAYPLTEKGNPSFREEVLSEMTTPLAKKVLEYREFYKLAHTYYGNMMRYTDANGYLHANVRQGGTGPGRVSYSEPNLQNQPKPPKNVDLSTYPVRHAFIPSDGCVLVMMDQDQVEYRLMMEYAQEDAIIDLILGGLDVHEATAQMLGITRDFAKIINFGLLYGIGIPKLARDLGISEAEAFELKMRYFSRLPKVSRFIKDVTRKVKGRRFLINWLGRRCYIEDPNFAYKGPNHIIQGGCGDIMKKGMNEIDEFLEGKKARTRMVIQVHDELVFDWHKNEYDLIAPVHKILERVYPSKRLPLTAGVDHSHISWAVKTEGYPAA